MIKTYKQRKEEARQNAIDWQAEITEEEQTPTLDAFFEQQTRFEKLGKRYGLVKEFRENGII